MLSYALAAITLVLISSALVKRSIASIDGSSGRTQPLIYDPPDYEDQYYDEEGARLNIRNGRPHPKITLFNLDGADETTEHDSFGSEVALTVVPGFGDGPAGLDVVPSFREQIRESGANRILVTAAGEKTFIPDGTGRWAPDPRDRVLEGWTLTFDSGCYTLLDRVKLLKKTFSFAAGGWRLSRIEDCPLRPGAESEWIGFVYGASDVTRIETNRGFVVNLAYVDGRISTITDQWGRVYGLSYEANRLDQVTLPAHSGTVPLTYHLVWSMEGDLLSLADPEGVVITYQYQPDGRINRISRNDGGSSSDAAFAYQSAEGISKTAINLPFGENGEEWRYSLATNKIVSHIDASGYQRSWFYDNPARPGTPTRFHDHVEGETRRYTYDSNQPWLLEREERIAPDPTPLVLFQVASWNPAHTLPLQVTTSERTTSYVYNANNQVVQTSWDGNVQTWTYDQSGVNTVVRRRFNGVPQEEVFYDQNHHQLAVNVNGRCVKEWTRNARGTVVRYRDSISVWEGRNFNSQDLPQEYSLNGSEWRPVTWTSHGDVTSVMRGGYSVTLGYTPSGRLNLYDRNGRQRDETLYMPGGHQGGYLKNGQTVWQGTQESAPPAPSPTLQTPSPTPRLQTATPLPSPGGTN
jgi:YD repeat-containing protein